MTAMALLEEARSFGVEIHCDGPDLVIRPGGRLPADLKERLRGAKPEIINILNQGSVSEEMQIISDPQAWHEDFIKWALERCALREDHEDAQSVGTLQIDFGEWCVEQDAVPADRRVFEALLTEAGFPIRDGLAIGVILKADLEASSSCRREQKARRELSRGVIHASYTTTKRRTKHG